MSTVRALGIIPKGSQGTIVRVLVWAQCLDVRFDAFPELRLIYHTELKLASERV